MNLFAEIKELVTGTLDAMAADGVIPAGLDLRNVSVEPPRDPSHGDMATNAAMVLAKPAKMKPRDIADALAARLGGDARLASVEVAGPGFLNLRLVSGQWQRVIPAALSAGTRFGVSDLGVGVKVNVEYVSANPTGPLHIGHTRGAVFGDALAELLDFAGYDVTREYYINDGGGQVDTLARSVFERYGEACGQAPQIAEGLYPGDYLIPVGQALKEQFGESLLGQNNEEWLPEVRAFATAEMM
ncbi:MAG: arginine--tRNA ligase, partial [Pseudomonadota bacterium]